MARPLPVDPPLPSCTQASRIHPCARPVLLPPPVPSRSPPVPPLQHDVDVEGLRQVLTAYTCHDHALDLDGLWRALGSIGVHLPMEELKKVIEVRWRPANHIAPTEGQS